MRLSPSLDLGDHLYLDKLVSKGQTRSNQYVTGDDWPSAISLGPYTTCNREGSIHVGDLEDFLYDVIHGGTVAFQ